MKKLFFNSVLFVFLGFFISNITIAQEGNKINSKYDFIPGEKVIFFDDFTSESVGDFPVQWNTSASGEIVTTSDFPGKWFQLTKGGFFIPEALEKFTDNFTIEFDFLPITNFDSEYMVSLDFFLVSGTLSNPDEGGAIPGNAGIKITTSYEEILWVNYSEKDEGYKDQGKSSFAFKTGEKYHVAFWVQKQRVRMYANETKVLDLPRGIRSDYTYNIFRIQTTDEISPLISNFRIAAGLPDMRNKLITDGKLISYGITFDVNSDKIKSESFATIKEIAQVLNDNPTVKIKVIGHTDSDGDDKSNLDLSKRRASSVKNSLVKDFSIDETRIQTDGKGEGEPVAPNDSGVNKALNRRVEFLKL
jgi:outer membrane protein OmpA-like peptidoglycan-associated protein